MAKPKRWMVQLRETTPITHPVPAAFWGEAMPKWDAEEHLQHRPSALPTLTTETQTHRGATSPWAPPPRIIHFPTETRWGSLHLPTQPFAAVREATWVHARSPWGARACARGGTGRPAALAPGVPQRPRLPFGVVPQLLLMI